jgi:hypothetical protein
VSVGGERKSVYFLLLLLRIWVKMIVASKLPRFVKDPSHISIISKVIYILCAGLYSIVELELAKNFH